MEHNIVYWRPSSSKISPQSSMMPLSWSSSVIDVIERQFLSADDEFVASEMHNWVQIYNVSPFICLCENNRLWRPNVVCEHFTMLKGKRHLKSWDSWICLCINPSIFTFTFTFMHLVDACIQSDLQCIQAINCSVSMCVPWELNPQPLRC